MVNSKIIIIVVVSIIVIKLFAVHYYLKTKINKNDKDDNDKKQ